MHSNASFVLDIVLKAYLAEQLQELRRSCIITKNSDFVVIFMLP